MITTALLLGIWGTKTWILPIKKEKKKSSKQGWLKTEVGNFCSLLSHFSRLPLRHTWQGGLWSWQATYHSAAERHASSTACWNSKYIKTYISSPNPAAGKGVVQPVCVREVFFFFFIPSSGNILILEATLQLQKINLLMLVRLSGLEFCQVFSYESKM